MSDPNPEHRRLLELLSGLVDERLTDADHEELNTILDTHPDAIQTYDTYLNMHISLSRRGDVMGLSPLSLAADSKGDAHSDETRSSSVTQLSSSVTQLRWYSLAASLVALVSAGWAILMTDWNRDDELVTTNLAHHESEPTHQTVAVLTRTANAVWRSAYPLKTGTSLRRGSLVLESGSAQFECYSGVSVYVEGPAELELISPERIKCNRGRIRANVPPTATSFEVIHPSGKLIDRGTEFAMNVSPDSASLVTVFSGKVELHRNAPDTEAAIFEAGESAKILSTGGIQSVDATPDDFLSSLRLDKQFAADEHSRQARWHAYLNQIAAAKSLIRHYTFEAEQPNDRVLRNIARSNGESMSAKPLHGAVVGCQWTEGRWSGTSALDFKRIGDRVRLVVPGEFDTLSIVAWVRIDSLDHRLNSLLMSDGYEPGELHWQINKRENQLVVGVQAPDELRGPNYVADNAFQPEHLAQWTQLAMVYDRPNQRVHHFIDGERIASNVITLDIPIRIGPASLGNWLPADHYTPTTIRNFNGRMDEVMMFDQALSGQAIKNLFLVGRSG